VQKVKRRKSEVQFFAFSGGEKYQR